MENQKIIHKDWHLRIRLPEGDGPHPVLLMLHGWKGNEDVMWIFANRLPNHYLVVAPRAIFAAEGGGFSWTDIRGSAFSSLEDFHGSVDQLINLMIDLSRDYSGYFSQIEILGFSQGAALAYAFALTHPERVRTAAGLAGFVPPGAERYIEGKPLFGKRIFAAHGTQDITVPVETMREGIFLLEKAGATITYCEDDTGHKLSTHCFRALGAFYQE